MPVKKATAAIELKHIHFALNGQEVLCDIDTTVTQGSYVGLVGPNGGGKTTLLKLILGFHKANVGSVKIFGEDPVQARKKGLIGYVPQRVVQTDFSFPATVEEIVRSGVRSPSFFGSLFSAHIGSAAQSAMETAGILHLRSRLIGNLSGGERQKVFIARALAGNPSILILDEPTTGVDSVSQEEFYALLRMLHKNGMTILFVSHDIEIMANEASNILCLNRTLAADCDACDFMHTDEAKRLYGGPVRHIHHSHH
jgi:zinc transport system ATP-binding protein